MRFALLGDHADGIDMALALVGSGRHNLHVFAGSPKGKESLRSGNFDVPTVGDLEEVLADPAVELVIVASSLAVRAAHLRRALQSERHVLCVFPPDESPDIAYEAAMIQKDTGKILLPLMPDGLHPGVAALRDFIQQLQSPLGPSLLIEVDLHVGAAPRDDHYRFPVLPGWDILRQLKGEIAEVSAFAEAEEVTPNDPLLVAGRFEAGGLFRYTSLPGEAESSLGVSAIGTRDRGDLLFRDPTFGSASLRWNDSIEGRPDLCWDSWNPWPIVVGVFEEAVAKSQAVGAISRSKENDPASATSRGGPHSLSWQDAVRSMELDDAARRSLKRRRASTLEYQEATEEAGFKGTMTLVGCGLLWVLIALAIASRWVPALGWLVIPLLVGFLGMQILRWAIPRRSA